MTKEEIKLIIMDFAEVFNESYSHYIIDSDVDKFLDSKEVVKKFNISGVGSSTDLEYSLYTQVVDLKEQKEKLEFMILNGLGFEDMVNDIKLPEEL